jgi:predicted HTH transcriptional regulator
VAGNPAVLWNNGVHHNRNYTLDRLPMSLHHQSYGPLFDICANRHQGNPQSVKANEIAHKFRLPTRQRILEILNSGDGMTCEELEHFTALSHQTCSARLSELRREEKIKIVGTRKTRSGSPAAIYQAA